MMKYCPRCGQKYNDSLQRFCLGDGALLSLPDSYRLIGSTLDGKYQVNALVGIGGFGAVYSAYHLGLDRQVAFKILQPNVALQAPGAVNLFESEAKTAARLLHENIVAIYDAGRTLDGISYIAMEWLEGRSLDQELAMQGRLGFERTAEILSQISAALAFAHSNRTVHRDLKSGNVMLVRRTGGGEQVKVVDFGIAKVLSSAAATTVSRSIGTPAYASPEQWKHGAQIDGRADIYALGVMLYEMITGDLPFKAQSVEELIRLKLNTPPPSLGSLLPEAPAEVEKLLRRMMAVDPNQRPQQVHEVPSLFKEACKTFADANPPGNFTTTVEAKTTEPLPIPPTQPAPFTAETRRAAFEPSHADLLSDRGGPISAVFSPEDFVEPSDAAGNLSEPAPSFGSDSNSGRIQSKLKNEKLFFLVMTIALGIGGLVIGAMIYFRQVSEARDAQEKAQMKSKIEKQNQKEGLIGNLRDRIAEISKRIQVLNKQSLKVKRIDWSESLNKLSQRLDGVSNMPSEQSQEINQTCDEIGKELSKIEEEVNNVQGLFPSTIINREPIKV